MLCPACGTAFDGNFCPACGRAAQPFAFVCMKCGTMYNAVACPQCGTPLGGPAPGSGARAVGSVVWSMGMIAFLLLLTVNIVVFVIASGLIVGGALAAGPRFISLYVLLPYPIGDTFDVSAAVFLTYFALVAAAIVAAYVWYGFRDAKPTAEAFTRPLDQFVARLEARSAWVATGQVFLAALFFQVVYVLILAVGGFFPEPPVSPIPLPPWYDYFALANAAVYEEVVTRWIFIGVPLFFAGLATARGMAPGAALARSARHLVGGTLNRDSPAPLVLLATVLIVVSSVVFGLAHVPAWGPWKFLPAMVAGLGMGYLFVRHGLLAAILFHFATDYLGATAILTGNDLGAQALLGLFLLILVGFGAFFFVWYAVYGIRVANYLAMRWGWRQPAAVGSAAPTTLGASPSIPPGPMGFAPPPPPPPGPAVGFGSVSYVCPACGWMEARYDAGRFTCLRCGRTYP